MNNRQYKKAEAEQHNAERVRKLTKNPNDHRRVTLSQPLSNKAAIALTLIATVGAIK